MQKEINVYNYFGDILQALKKGILITAKKENRVNSMTISWGQIGVEWNKLIFTTYIRKSRYTHELLESGEFTVNIPVDKSAAKIIGFCGTKSGRDIDKIKELDLTLVDGKNIDVPGIKELPLTLECKIIYKQDQDENSIPQEIKDKFYPKEISDDFHGANGSYHTMFYGEIVSAYIL